MVCRMQRLLQDHDRLGMQVVHRGSTDVDVSDQQLGADIGGSEDEGDENELMVLDPAHVCYLLHRIHCMHAA